MYSEMSQLCIFIYPFPYELPFHSDHYSELCRVSCAIQYALINYFLYIVSIMYMCPSQSPNSFHPLLSSWYSYICSLCLCLYFCFANRITYTTFHWKDWCWSWNSNTLATSCEELTHWKRPWYWEGLGEGGEGDNRGWDGWMASLTQRTWVWVNFGSWWWTGGPDTLHFMGTQRVGHDWAIELNWNHFSRFHIYEQHILILLIFVNTSMGFSLFLR